MVYVEDALGQLRAFLDGAGLKYDLGAISEKQAELTVVKNNISIRVWFEGDKQLFGFDMIQGGCKTYQKFEDFVKMFKTYVTIHTDFLPRAKIVADTFEEALSVSTVYDNFFGNANEGYSALFRVLGSENIITVSKATGYYIARYGYNSEDGTTFNTVTEYHYEVDDVGNISLLPTIYSYLNELSARYDTDDSVDIERIGVDEFNFGIEDICVHAKVEFMYKTITYKVLDISGAPIQLSFTLDNNPYSLSDLYMQCKSPYDDYLASQEDKIEDKEVDNSELDTEENIETIENSEEVTTPVEEFVEEVNKTKVTEPEEISEQPTIMVTSVDTAEDTEESVEMSVKALWGTDAVESLQFIVDNNIYIMSLDKASSIGIPVKRITDKVSYVNKHGMLLTEDEVKLKKFSEDITDNDEICMKLFSMIFS